jgi:hypothetical protein
MSLANRAQQTSSTKGTATYVLDGTKPGRQRLSTAMAKVAARLGLAGGTAGPWTIRYTATDATGRHEVGYGTLTRGTAGAFDTLTRDEILDSAANDGAVNWPTGTRTITVTIDGDAVASLLDLNAPLGPVQRTGRDRYGWGIVADGETDNADALEAAINGANGQKIILPPGTLRVSRALNITADAFHLCGEKAERGQPTLVIDNAGTVIDASEIEAGQWFISRYETSNPASIIGPSSRIWASCSERRTGSSSAAPTWPPAASIARTTTCCRMRSASATCSGCSSATCGSRAPTRSGTPMPAASCPEAASG